MPETLADKIMKRADAAVQIQYLQETYEAEKKRRIEFREWATPDVKAEFINGKAVIPFTCGKEALECKWFIINTFKYLY